MVHFKTDLKLNSLSGMASIKLTYILTFFILTIDPKAPLLSSRWSFSLQKSFWFQIVSDQPVPGLQRDQLTGFFAYF